LWEKKSKVESRNNRSQLIGFIVGIVAVLILTVILIQVIMSPTLKDLINLVLILGLTSLISMILGFVSYQVGLWRRIPRISYTLTLGYMIASGLIFLNVWITARLMFINQHDLALGSLLLLFAGGISIAYGYFLSRTISRELELLTQSAQQLSKGDFSIRVPVQGQDEIARLAEAFNQMAAQLERAAEKEQALDQARRNLVAWASHDLRTPLTSLRVMIDALKDEVVDDPATVARYLQQSQAEINRMSHLIDDLFEMAQLEAGYQDLVMQWIDLADLVSDTLESFAARADSQGISLNGVVDPAIDLVCAAPEKLSRILDNLISNALRYTPQNGTISITAKSKGGSVLVEVADSGSGIDLEDLPHIFDPFYRGEKSRSRDKKTEESVGLGLSIVKGLVEAHGGEIWVNSDPGQGTTFSFSIPKPSQDS
jgi:signal transduction histidine kinase